MQFLYPILLLCLVVVVLYILVQKKKERRSKPRLTLAGPKGYPYVGNLFQLGPDHALTYEQWAKKYGPVYQVRLGTLPVVVVNTVEAAKKLLVDQGQLYLDRPVFYTFKNVSSTAGFTIGTSPWDESCRTKRKAAASGLNKGAVDRYVSIIQGEVKELIRDFYTYGGKGKTAIDPQKFLQRFALNVSLVVNYGTRMRGVSDELFKEITDTEHEIANFRSVANSYLDHLPILRYLPTAGSLRKHAIDIRKRRDNYMTKLLTGLRDEIAREVDRSCITGTILKDPQHKLTPMELSSICLSMVSAGLDTLGSTLYWSMAHLAKHPEIQKKAHDAMRDVYGENRFNIFEQKVEYLTALHKEATRYFSVLKLGLPKKTIGESRYENHVIPTGTTVFYNAFAMNRDPKKYKNPEEFNPDRFMENTYDDDDDLPHFGFGIGRRMCIGKGLAEREMYIVFGELVEHFEIKLSEVESEQHIDTNPRTATGNPSGLAHSPRKYKVRFVPRNIAKLEAWLDDKEL